MSFHFKDIPGSVFETPKFSMLLCALETGHNGTLQKASFRVVEFRSELGAFLELGCGLYTVYIYTVYIYIDISSEPSIVASFFS